MTVCREVLWFVGRQLLSEVCVEWGEVANGPKVIFTSFGFQFCMFVDWVSSKLAMFRVIEDYPFSA